MMSTIRRVVTGHATSGESRIAGDDELPAVALPGLGGIAITKIWGAEQTMSYPDDGSAQPYGPFFAPKGGFRFVEFIVPPDAAVTVPDGDPEAALAEVDAHFPGLLATMDPERPGMHRSATIDLLYCVSGRIILELDDGSKTEIVAGDTVVQSGTMHAWRNPWHEPCRIVAVILGADYAP